MEQSALITYRCMGSHYGIQSFSIYEDATLHASDPHGDYPEKRTYSMPKHVLESLIKVFEDNGFEEMDAEYALNDTSSARRWTYSIGYGPRDDHKVITFHNQPYPQEELKTIHTALMDIWGDAVNRSPAGYTHMMRQHYARK